jgi:hypothetical protein
MNENRDKLISDCFQRILNLQSPWGEWFPISLSKFKEGGRSVSESHIVPKPMVSITLMGLELLSEFGETRFKNRINKGNHWISGSIKDGWFIAWQVSQRDTFIQGILPIDQVKDMRHTAPALISILKFGETMSLPDVMPIVQVIMECQLMHKGSYGAWAPSKGSDNPEPFTTAMCDESLHLFLQKFNNQIGNAFREKVWVSINDAESWLHREGAANKGWHLEGENPWQTVMTLCRIGPQLKEKFPNLLEEVTQRLLGEAYKYNNDFGIILRITGALNRINGQTEIEYLRNQCIEKYSPSEMEPNDFIFFIRSMEPAHIKKILTEEKFFDYMEIKNHNIPKEFKNQTEEILLNLLIICFEYIKNLTPGVKAKIKNYQLLYDEELKKIGMVFKELSSIGSDFAHRIIEARNKIISPESSLEELINALEKDFKSNSIINKIVNLFKEIGLQAGYNVLGNIIYGILAYR